MRIVTENTVAPQGGASSSMSTQAPVAEATEVVHRRELPSGRTVLVLGGSTDEIEVRSPTGQPEVRITFGPNGPEVSLRAARLELDAPTLAVRCRDLDVRAEETVSLDAGKALALRSAGELRV